MNTTTCGFIAQHFWELPFFLDENRFVGLSIQEQLKRYAKFLLKEQNITHFMILMESGIPLDAASAILELRAQYSVTLECVIPFEEQHIDWSEEERDRYFTILEQCDKEHMLQRHFSLDCYQRSSKYLVAHASLLLVLCGGSASDAGDAIKHARKKGRPVLILNAEQLCNAHV